jgi:tRNA 2-thiouridine synthesizing protein A
MAITPNQKLDCSGLACPMPIIKTKKAMDGLKAGEVLEMTATDPGSVSDVQAWTKKTGNELLDHNEDGKTFVFYIKKTK